MLSLPDAYQLFDKPMGEGEACVVLVLRGDPEQVDAAKRAAIVAIAKAKAEFEREPRYKPCGCGS